MTFPCRADSRTRPAPGSAPAGRTELRPRTRVRAASPVSACDDGAGRAGELFPHRIPPSPSLAAVPLLEVYMISRAPNRVQTFVYWRCLWLRQTAFCTLQVCRKGSSQNQPLLPPSSRRVWELASNSGKKNELKRTRGSNLVGGETRRGSGKESGLSILRLCFVFATWSELH